MEIGRSVKRKLRAAAAPLFFFSLVGYFGWSATQGDHGLVAYAHRQQLLKQAQSDLAQVQAERTAWEYRVAALRTDHLDADMLDERARAMLNLSDPADIIVPTPEGDGHN